MIYFFAALIILIPFLVAFRGTNAAVRYLTGMLAFFFGAFIFMVLYLSKDVRYFNIIGSYFLLPRSVMNFLMFLPLSQPVIIRLMNLSVLASLYLCARYAVSYRNERRDDEDLSRLLARVLFWMLAAEYLFYDPLMEKLIYLFAYPYIVDAARYRHYLSVSNSLTAAFNLAVILLCAVSVIRAATRARSIPYIRHLFYGELAGYMLLVTSYLLLFWDYPRHLIRYSRVTGYTAYESLPLTSRADAFRLFPYFLTAACIIVAVSILTMSAMKKRFDNSDLSISSHIDAANTTSKAFCHYMKNELLAVQAEIRMLDVSDEGEEDRRHVLERCDNIYRRLNAIHSATKESKLTLVPTSLSPMLYEMIGRMSTELSGIRTDIRVIGQIPQVLADREYLEEAIHNLITNAVDVLKEVPEERRSLRVQLQNLDDWVILSVEDTGPGITAGNLKHIFDPFFSSSPISEHWGIGLTMTYRIVKAHSGRITVQTKEGQGTTFQILLPALSGGFMPGHASGSLKESGGPA